MQKKGLIKNKISIISKKISELTKIQKLVLSIVLLIIFILISKSIQLFFKDDNVHYNYDEENMAIYSLLQENVTDNNLFVTLKKIADDFFYKTTQYYNNKVINENDIYNYCLTDEYKNNVSKSEFKSKYRQVLEKVNRIRGIYKDIVPSSIVVDSDGYYILIYSYTIDNENVELYIGVAINESVKKYYIWYLE